MNRSTRRLAPALLVTASLGLGGCGFNALDLPLPGGADVGDNPKTVTIEFRDVLDLVPQSAVRVDDLAVGRVKDITLDGWTAKVTVVINGDVDLPDNAEATIRQSSLLGEKFVSLAAPPTGATGELDNGDTIPLERAGRNPEVEEVLGAASLLLNGGGLEKTNTIVKELNNALSGNEPEIKQLLQTTTTFLEQLDTNKDSILASLEKVNNLAITANGQRAAIEGALDNLPEALRTLNEQRDDLVRLTTSLQGLGNTATGVIQQTRADTVANLKALEPVLRNLAAAGSDLVKNFSTFATFPFSDNLVGGSLAAAQAPCPTSEQINADASLVKKSPSACQGDFTNLYVNIDLNAETITDLLGLRALDTPVNPTAVAQSVDEATGGSADGGSNPLVAMIEGLASGGAAPAAGASPAPSATPSASVPGTAPAAPAAKQPSIFCTLFGACRTAPASVQPSSDLAQLLLRPVVSE